MDAATARRNRTTLLAGAGLVVGMVVFAFAAARFYAAFCRATGLYGTTQVVGAATASEGHRTIRVMFDANVAPSLDWRFEPETAALDLPTGRTATVYFRARNLTDAAVDVNATFNVTPEVSGPWFDKIQCFCFQQESLGARESAEWPVVFFLDPKLETDPSMTGVDAITLSYTLFPAHEAVRRSAP